MKTVNPQYHFLSTIWMKYIPNIDRIAMLESNDPHLPIPTNFEFNLSLISPDTLATI